ncbi:MAG: 50S ribosomal protein L25/general stress protein Ctc [Pseudomonadota bacterium]
MTTPLTLLAEPRSATGKGPNRRLRSVGKVPAIVYGGGADPLMCALVAKDVRKELRTNPRFFSSVVELDLAGKKLQVVPREAQLHPVTDDALHLDFIRVTKGSFVTVQVPVLFLNEERSVGLKRGGVLNVVRRELELVCPVDAIPERIEIDLAEAEIGDSLHISAVSLPEGVTPTITDRDFTIATITGKGGAEPSDEPEAEAEAEIE